MNITVMGLECHMIDRSSVLVTVDLTTIDFFEATYWL
jgi:hypothetical protein